MFTTPSGVSKSLSVTVNSDSSPEWAVPMNDIEVRLFSFLQFFVSPGIDRPGMFEFVRRRDESLDCLPACSEALISGPSFEVKNPLI